LLINLYERPDPPELLESLGAESLHLPVRNSDPPSQAQLERGVGAIREALATGRRVAVHCGAGLGRTGTLLAAYLVSEGYPAEEAITRIREVRPGSVETLEQEYAVHEFERRTRST
jgi:atypical dual specificity phosphatase